MYVFLNKRSAVYVPNEEISLYAIKYRWCYSWIDIVSWLFYHDWQHSMLDDVLCYTNYIAKRALLNSI